MDDYRIREMQIQQLEINRLVEFFVGLPTRYNNSDFENFEVIVYFIYMLLGFIASDRNWHLFNPIEGCQWVIEPVSRHFFINQDHSFRRVMISVPLSKYSANIVYEI